MFTNNIKASTLNVLWHFATGYLPDFLNKKDGPVGWVRWTHRGVQFLDKLVISRKQKSALNSAKFELRYNTAFEEVLRATADVHRSYIQNHFGQTWITPPLIEALLKLHRLGHAHSFETWKNNQLIGGIWGVQIGGLVTMSSMFTRVSDASRFAMGRTMLHLRDRGFAMIDMGMVPDHRVHFGAQWLPRWRYESMLPTLIRQNISISDLHPCPPLSWQIRLCEPLLRSSRGLANRLGSLKLRYIDERSPPADALCLDAAAQKPLLIPHPPPALHGASQLSL